MLLTSSLLCAAKLNANDDIDSDPCEDSDYVYKPSPELPLGRWNFPEGFIFGTATSSYQVEGASNIDGKGPSVWDRFTHDFPDRIEGGGNGDIAIDHYHRFKEDVQRMVYMNVDAYRFSISWPRVIPSGRRNDGINDKGIAFYHKLLDVLIENKIDPYVTIWHWDTPQLLEAEYGGFLSRNIVDDYVDYCDLLFEEYGSKVKKWITLNEPMGTTAKAYDEGVFAPGRCSPWVNRSCRGGDSGIEPYIVAHNLLLAHSAAYHLYKSKYQMQHLTAEIGVTYVTHWFVPYSNATKDVDAAQRALDWMYGWFMDPITFGNYPETMVKLLGSRLPKFTEEESRLLRKSYDFLGLNYYTAYYVKQNDDFDEFHLRYANDSHGITTGTQPVLFTTQPLGSYWQYFYPEGLRVLLEYTKETYMDPIIYITENGLSEKDNATQTLAEALRDESRIDFYNSHLTSVLTAMKEKQVNVKGFFAWSYADNFEWNEGYTVRFGLNYVNYTDLSRHPKYSACWFTNFCIKTKPMSFDPYHLFTTSSTNTALGGRRALYSSNGRFN
ncbi:Isoflavonoid 7-O-beta-apiosyl-glucoside beta-glycosidase [Linum perenne]